jgi:hypothetical protein
MNGLQTAIQLNQIQVQTGQGEPLNYAELVKEVLREAGFKDVERFTESRAEEASQGASLEPAMGASSGQPGGTISTALQALAFGQQG